VVDITEVSAVVAAAGVLVGVVYYILDLRHQTKVRQTDLLARLYSTMTTKEWMESWGRVNAYDMKTTNLEKLWTENQLVDFNVLTMYFEELGVLVQMKLLDVDQVEKLLHRHVERMWEKLKPVVEEIRKVMNDPQLGQRWEYLYNELKKRQQKLQPSKISRSP
jgi:hypothetical protein